LDGLKAMVDLLDRLGFPSDQTRLDLSFARGVAYYTGMVFEAHVMNGDRKVAIGGGGRYDDLVQALGGADVPALGFAFTIEQILAANETLSDDQGAATKRSQGNV
jgi:histidyl-tRNA synthetase